MKFGIQEHYPLSFNYTRVISIILKKRYEKESFASGNPRGDHYAN
jgi:hypothetical protein